MAGRARKSLDVARLAEVLKTPGIDPRIWASYGVLKSDPYPEAGGIYASCQLQPSEIDVTVRIASAFTGAAFGASFPVKNNQEVLCIVPMGNMSAGVVALPFLWNNDETVPQEVIDAYQNSHLLLEDGTELHVAILGDRGVSLTWADGSVTLINADQATFFMDATRHEIGMRDSVGNGVLIQQNGQMTITGTMKVAITSPLTQLSGAATVAGALTVSGNSMIGGVPIPNGKIAPSPDMVTWMGLVGTATGAVFAGTSIGNITAG